eukprot:TRINITY_DN46732_c0_g1_i1.p1 TRINITY_DN46732_c0_g1~~TRINITY_DN46732_c0_g1_i1.p1  ORF type:complete len:189 (+),score=33.80 TRINITY_DN46732_c0_g1_i1:39-569(+)
MSEGRKPLKPNVLITGTPGTGKTTLAKVVAEVTGLVHINVGEVVKENGFIEGKDTEFDSLIPDEDALLDFLEDTMVEGGKVVDYHSSELFPERWFQLVIVLRCDTPVLFDRLVARGYSDKKRQENMDCEIIGVCLEEALESYSKDIVHEMKSNTVEDQDEIVEKIQAWCLQNGISP